MPADVTFISRIKSTSCQVSDPHLPIGVHRLADKLIVVLLIRFSGSHYCWQISGLLHRLEFLSLVSNEELIRAVPTLVGGCTETGEESFFFFLFKGSGLRNQKNHFKWTRRPIHGGFGAYTAGFHTVVRRASLDKCLCKSMGEKNPLNV